MASMMARRRFTRDRSPAGPILRWGLRAASVNGEQPATSKQLGYLKVLGVEVPAELTKQCASELIDEAQAKVVA